MDITLWTCSISRMHCIVIYGMLNKLNWIELVTWSLMIMYIKCGIAYDWWMVMSCRKAAGNFNEILLFKATWKSQNKIAYYGCIESIYDDILSIKQKHYCISIFLCLISMYIMIPVLCSCSPLTVTDTFLNFQLSLYVYDSHKESAADIINSLKTYNNVVFHYFSNTEFALVF